MRSMACALTALVVSFAGVADGGESKSPHEVLTAVERAYAAGDTASMRGLLTADFEYLTQQGIELSVDQDLELLGRFFNVGKRTLSFSKDLELKCISVGPRTWGIPNLEAKLAVTDGGETHEVTNRVTLYLMEDMDTGEVRISRWIEEPTSLQGCD